MTNFKNNEYTEEDKAIANKLSFSNFDEYLQYAIEKNIKPTLKQYRKKYNHWKRIFKSYKINDAKALIRFVYRDCQRDAVFEIRSDMQEMIYGRTH